MSCHIALFQLMTSRALHDSLLPLYDDNQVIHAPNIVPFDYWYPYMFASRCLNSMHCLLHAHRDHISCFGGRLERVLDTVAWHTLKVSSKAGIMSVRIARGKRHDLHHISCLCGCGIP